MTGTVMLQLARKVTQLVHTTLLAATNVISQVAAEASLDLSNLHDQAEAIEYATRILAIDPNSERPR